MSGIQMNSKVSLLFTPENIFKYKSIFQVLTTQKTSKGTLIDVKPFEKNRIKDLTATPINEANHALLKLTEEQLLQSIEDIKKKYKLQRAGVSFADFLLTAYSRQLLERFEHLKPFAHLFKWSHKKYNPVTGNSISLSCAFSTFKPLVTFEVIMQDGKLHLQTSITINQQRYAYIDFKRTGFLLESANEYFLLSSKDFQILNWIDQLDFSKLENNPSAFAEHILSILEKDYTVERNGHFSITQIEVEPINRILLSEISNSFLVITPQWMYDGYLTEGSWTPNFEVNEKGETLQILRNKEQELLFVQLLKSLHPNFTKQLNGYFHINFAEAQKKQWFLKVYHQLLEMNIEIVGMDMLQHFRYSPHKPTTDIKILENNKSRLSISFKLKFDKESIPNAELKKMLLSGQRAVMLKDGALGVLSDEWLQNYSTIIRHSKIENDVLYVPQWIVLGRQQEPKEVDAESISERTLSSTFNNDWWKKWELWQHSNQQIFPIPSQISATLRPYQQKGFEWMKLLAEINAGACLADDMGLGKTLQTICFIVDELHHSVDGTALIVCPSSLMYNWQKEFSKFAPEMRIYIHHGINRDIAKIEEYDVCITSYGTLRSDIETLSSIPFDVTVVDESHNIKNPSAHITRAISHITSRCRIALSGTPVMNNTFDLYAQLEFLLPGMFGSREFFKREYADPIDRDGNEEKTNLLQQLTAPFILRRTKEQVAPDLPAKTESILWCNMDMAQKDLYNEIRDSIKSNLFTDIKKDGLSKSKLAVLQGIMKLKQVCSSPMLLPVEEQTTQNSVKTKLLLEELENLLQHKVLIFSQFANMLDILAKTFTKKGLNYYLLDGSTPAKKRAEMVEEFQTEGNTTQIFLISLMAGNTGLTLTAADYVFLFDPWWNNAVQQQAIDRTHRIGQTKNVFAYKMICKDTIEEKIIQLQERKTTLSENLIGDHEGFVKALTKEDVEFLFG